MQNTSEAGTTDVTFTVGRADRVVAEQAVHAVAAQIGARGVEVDDAIAKVSIIGVGMVAHPGVAATMFEALAKAGINIQIITTSEIKVTCVIARDQTDKAVNALHAAFALDQAPAAPPTSAPKPEGRTSTHRPERRKSPRRPKTRRPSRRR